MSRSDTAARHLARVDQVLKDAFGWYVVAKKEFKDAIRSKGLWLLAFVFTVLFVTPPAGALYFGLQLGPGVQEVGMQVLVSLVYTNTATVLVPIIALFVGVGAITKERESGSLKILLSLPHTRQDVIVGKVVGRCAVAGVPMVVAFVVTAGFIVATSITFKPGLYGLFALYTLGLALVFVSIAVGISGAVSRSLYSIVGNTVVYIYFTFGWNTVANAVATGLHDHLGISGSLRWHLTLFIKLLNPSQSYKTLTNSMLGQSENAARAARYGMFNRGSGEMRTICADVLNGNATVQRTLFGEQVTCQSAGQSLPFYFTDAAVFVYLLLWIGFAALLSYYTFNRADL